jgi:hypothetical protein
MRKDSHISEVSEEDEGETKDKVGALDRKQSLAKKRSRWDSITPRMMKGEAVQ